MTSLSEMPELRTAQRWGHLSLLLLVVCFVGLGARLAYIHTAMNGKLLTYRSAPQTSIYRVAAPVPVCDKLRPAVSSYAGLKHIGVVRCNNRY